LRPYRSSGRNQKFNICYLAIYNKWRCGRQKSKWSKWKMKIKYKKSNCARLVVSHRGDTVERIAITSAKWRKWKERIKSDQIYQ
jgi:hypothetical protein